jgi:hypothetical protein
MGGAVRGSGWRADSAGTESARWLRTNLNSMAGIVQRPWEPGLPHPPPLHRTPPPRKRSPQGEGQGRPVHDPGLFRRQERRTPAISGGASQRPRVLVGHGPPVSGRIDDGGQHSVHRDPVLHPFLGQGAGEIQHGGLGRPVGRRGPETPAPGPERRRRSRSGPTPRSLIPGKACREQRKAVVAFILHIRSQASHIRLLDGSHGESPGQVQEDRQGVRPRWPPPPRRPPSPTPRRVRSASMWRPDLPGPVPQPLPKTLRLGRANTGTWTRAPWARNASTTHCPRSPVPPVIRATRPSPGTLLPSGSMAIPHLFRFVVPNARPWGADDLLDRRRGVYLRVLPRARQAPVGAAEGLPGRPFPPGGARPSSTPPGPRSRDPMPRLPFPPNCAVRVAETPDTPPDTPLLVVGVFQGEDGLSPVASALDRALGGAFRRSQEAGDFRGREEDQALFYGPSTTSDPVRFLFQGLGARDDLDREGIRKLAGRAVRRAEGLRVSRLHLAVPGTEGTGGITGALQAAAEALVLAAWDFREFRTPGEGDEAPPPWWRKRCSGWTRPPEREPLRRPIAPQPWNGDTPGAWERIWLEPSSSVPGTWPLRPTSPRWPRSWRRSTTWDSHSWGPKRWRTRGWGPSWP